MALSERINALSESQTIGMAKKARALKSEGHNIISLSLGEPDFKTPEHIKEAAKKAVDEGYTTYTPVPGYPELREAIAEKLKKDNNLNWKAENIVVSTGAKQSIANVALCLLDPGDEVVIFTPYWVSYKEIVKMAGGVPVYIDGGIDQDFKATAEQLEKAITEKTKLIMFSSPCNPTGAVFSEEELRAIAEVIAKHKGIYVIADEIYEFINFTGNHFSIGSVPEIKEQVITVNGFSKGYAMTGWRLGYIAAVDWIAKATEKLQGQYTSGTCSIAQRAAISAVSEDMTPTKKMAEAFDQRRKLVFDLLSDIEGFKSPMPQGAFYFFPDISAFFGKSADGKKIENATDFAMYLLNEAHVSTVTGEAFGAPNCIRLSYAAAESELKEALARIKKAVSKLS